MAFIRNVFNVRFYKCDGCGIEDRWRNETWQAYGSLAHEEVCPNDILTACCDKCMTVIMQKLKTGEYKMPGVTAAGYYCNKTSERHGY